MSFDAVTEPVCARHPDRVTYIVCHRCGNGICTECMTAAPVGFQCPSCVREGQRSVRAVREFAPRVTYAIITVCVAVQVSGMLGIGTSSSWLNELSLYPARIAVLGEYWRLITAVFVHAGWLHIGMNMLMLWLMGRSLEQAIGHVRFAVLFLVAGFGGAVASYWFNDPMSVGIGASGAIFGLFAAIFVYGREARLNTQEILGVIGLNLALGFIIPGVDWRAHIGGLLTGAVVGWGLLPARNRVAQVAVPLLTAALLSGLTVLRSDALVALFTTMGIHS